MRNPSRCRCRICSCTQDNACPGGCGWGKDLVDGEPICTVCEAFLAELEQYVVDANKVSASSLKRLLGEVGVGSA